MKKIAIALACLCAAGLAAPAQARIVRESWGETSDHQKVDIYTLTNSRGATARITNYGAFLVSLNVPDKTGRNADVVLGYDKLEDYTHGTTYGAVIGRFANRIGGANSPWTGNPIT